MKAPEFWRDFGFPVRTRLQSRWVAIDGCRWHSRSSSRKDDIPFVLVHGLMISSIYMIPLAERLAREAEVHAVDLTGFGRSDGPHRSPSIPEMVNALVRWLDSFGIEQCHLVANSMGCQVCTELAARFPDRVATLTLIGPTIDSEAHSILRQALRLARELAYEPVRLWLDHLVDFFRAGPIRIVTMIRSMFQHRITLHLPHVKVPVLVLHGENDVIAPEKWTHRVASLVPNGRQLTIADAAHCVHYTHPEETAEAILSLTRPANAGK